LLSEVAVNFAPVEVIIRDMVKPQRAVDDFLANCRSRRLSERTVTTYARTLDEFASRPDVRDLDVSKITLLPIERYLATKSKLARGTVSGIETHLYMLFEYLARPEDRKIPRNPMYGMLRTRRAASEDLDVVTVSTGEVFRMLEAAYPGTELNAMSIAAYLGPRRHALAMLRSPDYNQATGEMRFHEKGDKTIWKPVADELRLVLDASIARGEISPSYPFQADPPYLVPPEGYLQRPAARDDRVIWRVVKKVAARAGVNAHVHALRAAFAVFYLDSFGRDTYGLQKSMGHSSMKTTETYLRRYDARKAMQPLRGLSWAGVNDGNGEASGLPQLAAKWLESSQVMGAGGFEPP
jgi:integrase